MGPDSGYVMYQVTVLGHFEFVGVRVRILCDDFSVMGQDKVIGLKLSVSVTASKKGLCHSLTKISTFGTSQNP
jgi:hypothetical protein